MRPLTEDTPKPLVEVDGKPLIHHLVSVFPPELDEIIIVIGYLGDQIRAYCGETFLGRPVQYVEQKKKEGTFRALELCRDLLTPGESFAVFYADDLLDTRTIRDGIRYPLAISVREVDDVSRFGAVTLKEDGSIKEIIEKPDYPVETNLATTSMLVLTPDFFSYEPPPHKNGELYLSTAVSLMARDHTIKPFLTRFWVPVGTPEDVENAERILKKNQASS